MADRIVGMYVHQHWSFNHPYAARTWTLEDWRGYLEGLHRLGYNTVQVWPMLETMPDPLTESDVQSLKKMASVIDMAHRDLGMKIYIGLCPNVAAKNADAARYTFQERPFFYCDYRVDPSDHRAVRDMIARREMLLAPLAQADGVAIIDSDPGGYPGSTNEAFVALLMAHRRMFDRLRPGIELIYWVHVGWQAYCDYYRTGEFRWGTHEEIADTLARLADLAPEPWGLANGREPAQSLGLEDRVIAFRYGVVEGEPSYPLTNFSPQKIYDAARQSAPRGVMANAQTHCLQIPHTFAFARAAHGQIPTEADFEALADDLIPRCGALINAAWQALAGADPDPMFAAAERLERRTSSPPLPGPLRGLLFGTPQRFIDDLRLQLRFKATFCRLNTCLDRQTGVTEALHALVDAAEMWQDRHRYKNAWGRPELVQVLKKIGAAEIDAALDHITYRGKGATPFEQIQNGFYNVETFGPRLMAALRNVLKTR